MAGRCRNAHRIGVLACGLALWCSVSTSMADTPSTEPIPTVRVRVEGIEVVVLRAGPAAEHASVATASKDEELVIDARAGAWLHAITPAGASGWVHLGVFHANRDFVLRALDRVPLASEPAADTGRAWDFDPFVEWSAAAAMDAARQRLDSARTPEDLAAFDAAVGDLLEQVARAGTRLDDLDQRFAAHVRTALEVTLAAPPSLRVARVEAWLDGAAEAEHVLVASETAALEAGGVLEVVRRVVEPRAQDLRVHVWLAGSDAPVVLETRLQPQPDRVLRVHVDIDRPDAPLRIAQSTFGGSH